MNVPWWALAIFGYLASCAVGTLGLILLALTAPLDTDLWPGGDPR